MIFERFIAFLFVICMAGVVGYFASWGGHAWLSASLAMSLAASVLYFLEVLRGFRFLKWLRSDDHARDVFKSGFWEEASGLVRKLLKQKELSRLASEESLRQFLAAIQASPNGVLLLDSESRIQWCNQTAAKLLGIDPQLDMQQLIGNMLRSPSFSSYVSAKAFDEEVIIEGRLHRVDNPHKVGIQIFPYGDGRMLLLSRDVTAIEQAEVMRRDFVANVSHEIRTPLTVLLGFVETLQTLQLAPAEQDNYLQLMAKQAFRMKSLVEDLLTLSRLEGSPFPSQQEWVSLATIFSQCEEDTRGLMAAFQKDQLLAHDLSFEIDDALQMVEVAGSMKELSSAFFNLTSNALRYTPPGGRILVNLSGNEQDGVVFSVQDAGPGISPEHLPRLSERFYRIDRSRSRDTGGTGLGLAIVKHVIQRHGGKLMIESKLNHGSTFSLTLPIARLRTLAQAA
jgi:two-component system phosphate regulon sensor histidine kinase PhoR